jgi:hypothetical protein
MNTGVRFGGRKVPRGEERYDSPGRALTRALESVSLREHRKADRTIRYHFARADQLMIEKGNTDEQE